MMFAFSLCFIDRLILLLNIKVINEKFNISSMQSVQETQLTPSSDVENVCIIILLFANNKAYSLF